MVGDIFHIPNFVSAKTKRGLRGAFLSRNEEKKKMFQYFDIQQEKDGTWTAWYYDKIDIQEELLNGDQSKSTR